MTNNDVAYVSEYLDEIHENLVSSEEIIDGLLIHYTNGDIDSPTIDRRILANIRNQIVGAKDLMTAYAIELGARKH